MNDITKRPFMILSDFMAIYQFMIDIYEKDWSNGVPAPFLEYALSSDWSDKTMSHRNMIWEDDDGRIVGFCFYESQLGKAFFNLRPGYEKIAPEMVDHAAKDLVDKNGNLKLIIFKGQNAVAESAMDAGYSQDSEYNDMIYDFSKPLEYALPIGDLGMRSGQEIRLGAVFNKETGEQYNIWDLFYSQKEEAVVQLLQSSQITDKQLILEMTKAIKPEYFILFPDNLEISFPRGSLPSQEHLYSLSIDYEDLEGVIHNLAITVTNKH